MTSVINSSSKYQYYHRSCALCGLENGIKLTKFQFCSKCRIVVYCSRDHQVVHWKMHKRFCKDNTWNPDNPAVVIASVTCSNVSCGCKTWNFNCIINTSSSITLAGSTSSSNSLANTGDHPVPVSEDYSVKSSAQEQVPMLTRKQSSSDVYRLNVDIGKNILEIEGQNFSPSAFESVSTVSSPSRRESYSNGPTEEPSRKIPLKGGSMRNKLTPFDKSNNPVSSNSVLTTTPLTSRSHPPLEDLENHAPAAAFPNFPETYSPVYNQIQPSTGNTSSSDFISLNRSCTTNLSNSLCENTAETVNSQENESHSVIVKDKNHQDNDKNSHESIQLSITSSSATIPFQHRNNMQSISGQTSQQQTRLWMLQVWQQVIEDMNRYGVCVVDNLLGEARGAAVLREVQSMYSSGAFQDGQLVKGKDNNQNKAIRGDKITWVDGREPNCKNIAVLIKLLDNIVMGANTFSNNGKLGTYRINERSKAMVACYPGSGTHYVKHVDNPNDDGRCITAIYYLNKDWSTSENGGLLRIFPEGWAHQVADIEPLFDRVIFFWSDRRNPHEVQPAFKTRYAITLWYFDSDAKARAKITESNKLPNLQTVN